jgi:hypothetical protein
LESRSRWWWCRWSPWWGLSPIYLLSCVCCVCVGGG